MLDLLVIGAGPHALSLVCRLIDDDPDLLTERERVRIMQKAGSRSRSHAAVRRHLKKKFDGSVRLPGVAVIDMKRSDFALISFKDFLALSKETSQVMYGARYIRDFFREHTFGMCWTSLRVDLLSW